MLANLFKVLSHPVRLQILQILSAQPDCICGSVIEVGSFSESTIVGHLKVLKHAGFIQGEVNGANRCYRLNSETVQMFKHMVERL